MNVALDFLQHVIDDLYNILQFEIIDGISIWTVLFYGVIVSVVFTVYTRRS